MTAANWRSPALLTLAPDQIATLESRTRGPNIPSSISYSTVNLVHFVQFVNRALLRVHLQGHPLSLEAKSDSARLGFILALRRPGLLSIGAYASATRSASIWPYAA